LLTKLAIFTLFSSWFMVSSAPRSFMGLVLSVHDGDSLTLLVNGGIWKTRLLYIDAPELSQSCERFPIGQRSQQFLEHELLGKSVRVYDFGLDLYQRHLVEVFDQNQSMNLKMVESGYSTLHPYSHFENIHKKQTFLSAFLDAKKKKYGLHQCSHLESPWHFRKRQKKVSQKTFVH
jgi:micrococcal nuclease